MIRFLKMPMPRWTLPQHGLRHGYQDIPGASHSWVVGNRLAIIVVGVCKFLAFLVLAASVLLCCAYIYMTWLYFRM